MWRRNPQAGPVVSWIKLRLRGYKRSITRLYRMLRKLWEARRTPANPKYIPRPYEKMLYPGQRIQIDVKIVPTACIVGDAKGKKFYQLQLLMNTLVSGTLKLSWNRVFILLKLFLSICSRLFRLRYIVFRQTTVLSLSRNSAVAKKPKDLTLFEAILKEYGEHTLLDTTAK